jgi:DNA-binding MarR family transcriptional regulator
MELPGHITYDIVVATTLFRIPMKIEIKVFPLENSPGYVIYRSTTRMKAELSRAFRESGFDVTPEQWSVLNKLWEIEGLNQMELAEKTSKDRHTITRILNLMEKKNFIIRKPDRKDNRCYRVYLTPKGMGLKKKLTPIVVELLQRAFSGFSKADMEDFRRIHEGIIRNLEPAKEMRPKSGNIP